MAANGQDVGLTRMLGGLDRLPGQFGVRLDLNVGDEQHVPAHRDRPQHLVLQHGRGEGRRGQVRDAAGDRVADHLLHPLGQVVVVQPEHDAQVGPERAGVQRRLQVDLVATGHRDQGDARQQAGRPQRLLPVDLADDHRHAQAAGECHPGPLGVAVDGHHRHAQVVQLGHHQRAHVAQPDHDHVAAGGGRPGPDRAGQPGPDDQRGDERHEHQAVKGEQDLRHLLRAARGRVGQRRARRVQHGQVQRRRPGVAGRRQQQDEPGHQHREQAGEAQAELVPEQGPQPAPHGPQRVAAPQRVARRPVGDGQHQVIGVLAVRGQQQRPGGRGGGQPAEHLSRVGGTAQGHVQGLAGHPHVAGSGLP